jgi:hypothetical protein
MINPAEKEWDKFLYWIFSQGIKPIETIEYSRMVKNISSGMPKALLYMNKNLGLQIFKLYFLSTVKSSLSLEHLVSIFKFLEQNLFFCEGHLQYVYH